MAEGSFYPNTPGFLPTVGGGTAYAGTHGSQVPSYVTNGVPQKSYYNDLMLGLQEQYPVPNGDGTTTQGPANIAAQQEAETKARMEEAFAIQQGRGYDRRPVASLQEMQQRFAAKRAEANASKKKATPTKSTGTRTNLSAGQIGRAIAEYESGNSKRKDKSIDDLYSDYFDLKPGLQDIAYNASLEKAVSTSQGQGQSTAQTGYQNRYNNAQGLAKATQHTAGVRYPSYSANPAGGYTNRTALGPSDMGPVSISLGQPADVGWGSGSVYDPNTGLSKWSTNGLKGEDYYGNMYAGQRSAEAQRIAASQANSAAALQRRIASGQRQDVRNQVVDALVAGGRDKSLARVDARNMTDAQLIEKAQQIEADAAKSQQQAGESQLNDLLSQFSNPNYGQAVPFNQPLVNSAQSGQGSAGGSYSGQGGGDVNSQYQQAVQAQQAQQQQQEQIQQQQQQLSQEYQQAYNAANEANNARYEDNIAGYQDNQQNISDYLTNQGNQQTEDVNRSYERLGASNRQDLISRGLGNTTVLSSTERGIEEDRQRALRNSQEQIDRQRLGYETQAQRDLLGFMERRTDAGPDYNQLIGLSTGLGSAGGGTPTTTPGGYGGAYGSGSVMSQPETQQYQGGMVYNQGVSGGGNPGGYQAPNSTGIQQATNNTSLQNQQVWGNVQNALASGQDPSSALPAGQTNWQQYEPANRYGSPANNYTSQPTGPTVGAQNESYSDRMFREQREHSDAMRQRQQETRNRQNTYQDRQDVANRSPEMQAIYDRSNAAIAQQQGQGQPQQQPQGNTFGSTPAYQPIFNGQQQQQPQQQSQASRPSYGRSPQGQQQGVNDSQHPQTYQMPQQYQQHPNASPQAQQQLQHSQQTKKFKPYGSNYDNSPW